MLNGLKIEEKEEIIPHSDEKTVGRFSDNAPDEPHKGSEVFEETLQVVASCFLMLTLAIMMPGSKQAIKEIWAHLTVVLLPWATAVVFQKLNNLPRSGEPFVGSYPCAFAADLLILSEWMIPLWVIGSMV